MEEKMTIYTTAPTAEGHPDKEIRTYKLLEELNIPFERIEHDAAFTIEACQDIDKMFGTPLCKNLLLCNSSKNKFFMLLLPGDKHFDTKELRNQIGSSRLSFAPGEYMENLLDITPGSLTVLGIANDTDNKVTLILDKDVITQPYICCHPCINTASLKIKTEDILNKFIPYTGHDPLYVDLQKRRN